MVRRVEAGDVLFLGTVPVKVVSICGATEVQVEYPEGSDFRRACSMSLSLESRDLFGAHTREES